MSLNTQGTVGGGSEKKRNLIAAAHSGGTLPRPAAGRVKLGEKRKKKGE